jgi:hypothetical protein
MEGHNTAPTEIGVLREERLYHPEEWKRQERHVRKKKNQTANYWKEAADQPFIKKRGISFWSPSNTMTKACSEIVQY